MRGFAATAAADVVSSKHNYGDMGGIGPCAYCHSVHNAVGGLGRPAHLGDLPEITEFYRVSKHDYEPHREATNNSDAPLCLTCHDGTTILATGMVMISDLILNSQNDIGVDLRNDHPTGFVSPPSARIPTIKSRLRPTNGYTSPMAPTATRCGAQPATTPMAVFPAPPCST